MWDLCQRATAKALALLVVASLSSLAAGCGDDTGSTERPDRGESSPATSPRAPETTGDAPLPEATLGPAPDAPAVSLRLEGDPGTTFSGICAVGDEESVLSGQIPKRYAFEPRGRRLSCRIQKQDSGAGSLKVILVAGNTTRSVQQTNAREGVINISYAGG